MIEVVLNSTTIAKIQKKARGARGAFDKKLLYQWLMDQNPDPVSKAKAIDNFIRSCAGCCVATYVLGIGDRHSDNIMLRKNGQVIGYCLVWLEIFRELKVFCYQPQKSTLEILYPLL